MKQQEDIAESIVVSSGMHAIAAMNYRDERKLMELMKSGCNECNLRFFPNHVGTVTFGLGVAVDELGKLFLSHRSAEKAIHSRWVCGRGIVIDGASPAIGGIDGIKYLIADRKKKLSTAMELMDYDGVKREFQLLISDLPVDAPKDAFYRAAHETITLLGQVAEDEKFSMQRTAGELLSLLNDCITVEQAAALLYETVRVIEQDNRENRQSYAIEFAKNYVCKNYRQEIPIKAIADQVNLTPKYFSELFKKTMGIGFSEYLCNYRLDVARDLLKSTGYQVGEISTLVGYQSPKHFTKQFKKVLGVSPAQFRKMKRD